ncbi:hypothetical protein BOTNAR_0055g00240 [Botryotinia narcissicola]|uniref:Uncharacterized protein n=1 Tax=Botryotinia narcissicola TaxID=278944 RepID=A0A4Z1JCS5_9HELO|nr:hypothetical protein BOTNAR_0055g00240 [Botryotinia narcissicola]
MIFLLGICFNGKDSNAQDMAWAIPMQAETETYFGTSIVERGGSRSEVRFVVGGTKVEDSHDVKLYDDWQLGRVDFYHNPLDFTNFNWDDFEQFDNDPCSEFLEVFSDEPSSESHQDDYSIPPVIADASPFVFPFETLLNAPVEDHQDIGSVLVAHVMSLATRNH